MADSFNYLLDGKASSYKEVRKYRHFVSINDDVEKDMVYVFKSADDFEKWTHTSRYATEFAQQLADIARAQKREDEDHKRESAQLQKKERATAAQLRALAKELKIPVGSVALVKEAQDRGILNSFIVFDQYGQSGNWRVGHWPIPDYNWIKFDKMPRSIIGVGLHSFYRSYWWPWWDFSWWLVGAAWTNLPWWIDGRVSSSW